MQTSLKAVVLVFVLALSSPSFGGDLFGFLGLCGDDSCGCGNPNCCDGCEPGCGCCDVGCCDASCGCEASCGCTSEPTCGCCEASCGCESGGYCCDGRKYGGQYYRDCGPCCPAPTRFCTPSYGGCCEPSCGCGDGCRTDCCEPTCGCCSTGCGDCCEPSCGCGDECCEPGCCRGCCGKVFGFCNRVCMAVCGGCQGCDSELYWSEWYNDPPRCCDPCDCHGNWTGPGPSPGCGCCNGGSACDCDNCGCNDGYGSMNYSGGGAYYTSKRPSRTAQTTSVATGARPKQSNASSVQTAANRKPNPFTQPRAARKPQSTRTPQQR